MGERGRGKGGRGEGNRKSKGAGAGQRARCLGTSVMGKVKLVSRGEGLSLIQGPLTGSDWARK